MSQASPSRLVYYKEAPCNNWRRLVKNCGCAWRTHTHTHTARQLDIFHLYTYEITSNTVNILASIFIFCIFWSVFQFPFWVINTVERLICKRKVFRYIPTTNLALQLKFYRELKKRKTIVL